MKLLSNRPVYNLKIADHTVCLGLKTKLMGVLNVTPDSFSDGGLHLNAQKACAAALRMQSEGADFIDVGGESTRPDAKPVSVREELRRVLPVLKLLSQKIQVPVSVDTYKYEVGSAALDHGTLIINDIKGLCNNRRLAKKIARYKAGVVLMHMRGAPQTMQSMTQYKNLLKDVIQSLKKSVHFALDAGIAADSIVVDPGFGFAKQYEQNFQMLNELAAFHSLKKPVLVGLSRKSFIGRALGLPVNNRLYGSLGAAAAAVVRGAHILRVHDVAPHRELVDVLDSVKEVVG